MRVTLSIVAIALIGISAYSEPPTNRRTLDQPPAALSVDNTTYINVNNILMFVTNHGNFGRDLADFFGNDGGTYFPYISNQSITDGTMDDRVLYAAGIWAGGVDAITRDTLVVVSEYSSEFGPGPMEGGTYLSDRPEFKVYKLYSDSLAANPNANYLNWPVDQGAPVSTLGEPAMLGDQMLWAVYNDADPIHHINNNSQTVPLGIEIQQTTWAFDSSTEPLASTIFIKYKIYNRGYRTLEDFYLSVWFDPDLGGPSDDMVGCDTINQTMFCYNGDNDDSDYGSKPPAFGCKVMYGPLVFATGMTGYFDGNEIANHWNLPMTAFTKYINGTDPDNYQETYAYMKGLRAKEPGFPPYQYNGQTLTLMHSGDPIAGTGDLDFNPSDKRMMASFGPLTFAPGDSQFVQIAVVAAGGTDRFNSLANLNYLMSQLGPDPQTPIAIRVPADYETIQEAIDVAWPGDTVLVAPGTYTGDGNRDLDFGGKNIVVISEDGPEVTIIDCQGTEAEPHRGFYFHTGESDQAVVEGFTITHGYATDGGAILSQSASPTIRGNTITGNTAVSNGGGIRCVYSVLHVVGNTISSNEAGDVGGDEGGGISLVYCEDYVVEGNTISGNFAYSGGGIGVFDSWGLIRDNTIEDNLAEGGGGIGMCCGSFGTVDSNVIVGNEAYNNGGGIYCNSGAIPTIVDNVVSRNTATSSFSYGGGICCNEAATPMTGNIVYGNSAANGGGLAIRAASSPIVQGCTLAGNSAANGGGIYCDNYSSPLVEHCIIAFSLSGAALSADQNCSPNFVCSDLFGNAGGDWNGQIADQANTNGDFSADPFFCDPENGDYHLSVISPCAPDNNSCQVHIGALGVDCGTYVCGDVDWDGELTAADVERIKDFYFSQPAEWQFPVVGGDMDCDGVITIADVVMLAGYIHGYGPTPCCAPPPKRLDLPGLDKNTGPPGE